MPTLRKTGCLAVVTSCMCAGALRAQDAPDSASSADSAPAAKPEGLLPIPDYSGDLLDRKYLLGDLWGSRSALADHGLQFEINFTQHGQSIVSGGRDTGTRYGGALDYLFNFDLQKMGLLPGAIVTMRAESRYGESVNQLAPSLLPINTDLYFPLTSSPDEDLAIALTELTYTQYLSEHFAVFIGKLNTLNGDPNEFASGRGVSQFSRSSLVFNPVSALAVPYSTLGGGVVWLPSQHVALTATLMNTTDSSTTTGFDDFGDGWTASVEAQFKYSLGDLPGGQNLGFIYASDADFFNLNGRFSFEPGTGLIAPADSDTWSVYWSGWQYLWTDGANAGAPINTVDGIPDRRGIGLFARLGTGDDDTMPISFHASGGVGGRGLIPSRPDDHFGVGYSYSAIRTGRIAGIAGAEDETQGFEAFYNAAITPAANLTFSVQVLEGLNPAYDTAVALGVRLNLRF